MIKARLVFVPPGGGEIDYGLDFELPGIPQPGDYIVITRSNSGKTGSEDFIVRRTWWFLDYHPDNGMGPGYSDASVHEYGSTKELIVECEFAIGTYSSDEHKRNAGSKAKEFENTAY